MFILTNLRSNTRYIATNMKQQVGIKNTIHLAVVVQNNSKTQSGGHNSDQITNVVTIATTSLKGSQQ